MSPAGLPGAAGEALRNRRDAAVDRFETLVGGPARARVIVLLAAVLALVHRSPARPPDNLQM